MRPALRHAAQRLPHLTHSRFAAALAAALVALAACADEVTAPAGAAPGRLRANAAPENVEQVVGSALSSSLCIGTVGEDVTNSASLISTTCDDGDPSQRLTFLPSGELRVGGSLCADASGGLGQDGDPVITYVCNGQANQRWALTYEGEIVGINGKCLDISGASTTPGTQLIIYACNSGTNQRWGLREPAPVVDFGTVAELPRTFLDTRIPTSTRTLTVASTGNLQAALDSAQYGDEIVLPAGATYTGNFVLPFRSSTSGAGWIVVRTNGSIPGAGTRVAPSDAAQMAKLVSPNNEGAIETTPGTAGWYFVGLEITAGSSVTDANRLIGFGTAGSDQDTEAEIPSRLVIARSYIHGRANLPLRRCVALNSASTAVIDSYVTDCHVNGTDSQGVGGWNGPGPYKIVNNHLEAGAEVILFGGSSPSVPDLVPSDIEVRRNHITRPLAWRNVWLVKNLVECKNCQRLLLEGNVMENNWADGQTGYGLLFQGLDDDNVAPWTRVGDLTIRYNVLRNTGQGISLASRVAYGAPLAIGPMERVTITNNLVVLGEGLAGNSGTFLLIQADIRDLTIARNTFVRDTGSLAYSVVAMGDADNLGDVQRLRILENVFGPSYNGFGGDGTFGNTNLTLATYAAGAVVTGSVYIGQSSTNFPSGNYLPATNADARMLGAASGDFSLVPPIPYLPSGARVPGVDFTALAAATAGVVQ